MIPYKSFYTASIPSWVLLPMRLFLGITFLYAGIQKLTDPQFFNPSAAGYIGKQMAGFALTSPLHSLLLLMVPHAMLFGLLTAYGEIAIGLGILFGVLFRPAAFFGMLLNLLFFLSATWRVYPYFYGSDIVFTFCWLTMLLNGPLNTSLPSVDEKLSVAILQRLPVERQEQLSPLFAFVLGIATTKQTPPSLQTQSQTTQQTRGQQQRRYSTIQRAKENRRSFLAGALTGGGSILGLFALGFVVRTLFGSTDTPTYIPPNSSSGSIPSDNATTPQAGSPIATASAVPPNSATSFTIPSNGDPGVLVHLDSGQFVAYDALCTHAGCQVDYDPSSKLLLCPCHGAAFDPAKGAAVVSLPAQTPLAPVSIHVDSATGAITLA
jgi:thiosulfate dehydrogenase [quinone] large subunit